MCIVVQIYSGSPLSVVNWHQLEGKADEDGVTSSCAFRPYFTCVESRGLPGRCLPVRGVIDTTALREFVLSHQQCQGKYVPFQSLRSQQTPGKLSDSLCYSGGVWVEIPSVGVETEEAFPQCRAWQEHQCYAVFSHHRALRNLDSLSSEFPFDVTHGSVNVSTQLNPVLKRCSFPPPGLPGHGGWWQQHCGS